MFRKKVTESAHHIEKTVAIAVPRIGGAISKCLSLAQSLLLCLVLVGCFFCKVHAEESSDYCAFCDPAVLEAQCFYSDDLVLALYTHKPILPGHCLIIPRRHAERFEMLTDEEMLRIGRVIRKVDDAAMKVYQTSSYLLLQKNGREVGQTVFHVHFHYIPRQEGDSSTFAFLARMFAANLGRPISAEAMREAVFKMQQALD